MNGTSDEASPEKIMDLETGVFAALLSEVLDDEDIPHRLVSYFDTAYAGIFQYQSGLWGHVEALPEHRERIIAIASDLERTTPQE
mgnify:CR=1 FL=1